MRPKLTRLHKLAYGAGDIFGGGAMTLVGIYYLVFLTDVVRLDPALVAIVLLVGRIWDGVTDPLMGFLSDRTNTRFGRRRPYFIAGIPLIIVASIFLWFPASLDNPGGRFVFVLAGYLFYSSVITMVMVPYWALAPEITSDYGERSKMMTWRMVLSNASSLICAVLPLEILKIFPDIRHGYIAMGTFFGLFFGLPYILTVTVLRERREFRVNLPVFSFRNMFIEPFAIRTFRKTLTMYLFTMVTMDVLMAVSLYYMKNWMMPGTDLNFFLGALLIAMMAGTVAFSRVAMASTKVTAFTIGAVTLGILMAGTVLLGPGVPDPALFAIFAVVGFAMGGPIVMVYAMLADVPDVDELYSGVRREGSFSGLITLCRKLSSALALAIVALFIKLGNYVPPLETVVDGAMVNVEQPQPDRFLITIRTLFAFLPALFMVFALLGARRFPLVPKVYIRLQDFLDSRRSGRGGAGLEESALRELLGD